MGDFRAAIRFFSISLSFLIPFSATPAFGVAETSLAACLKTLARARKQVTAQVAATSGDALFVAYREDGKSTLARFEAGVRDPIWSQSEMPYFHRLQVSDDGTRVAASGSALATYDTPSGVRSARVELPYVFDAREGWILEQPARILGNGYPARFETEEMILFPTEKGLGGYAARNGSFRLTWSQPALSGITWQKVDGHHHVSVQPSDEGPVLSLLDLRNGALLYRRVRATAEEQFFAGPEEIRTRLWELGFDVSSNPAFDHDLGVYLRVSRH